jgi:hypothetical protein
MPRTYKGHTLTKRTYEQAAAIARNIARGPHAQDWPAVVAAFAQLFEHDGNPRFDVGRFTSACVPPKEEP